MQTSDYSRQDWTKPLSGSISIVNGTDVLFTTSPVEKDLDCEYVWLESEAKEHKAVIGGRIIARQLAAKYPVINHVDVMIKFCGAREYPLINFFQHFLSHNDEVWFDWSFTSLPPDAIALDPYQTAKETFRVFSFGRLYYRLTLFKQELVTLFAEENQPKSLIHRQLMELYRFVMHESEAFRKLTQCDNIQDLFPSDRLPLEKQNALRLFWLDVKKFDVLFWKLVDFLEQRMGECLIARL